MEVQVETAGGLTRRLHVTIPADRFEREVGERLKRLAGRARVPGFRPGKAPLKVIQQQYGADARNDAVGELVRQTWPEALTQSTLQPASSPNFNVTAEAVGQPLVYTASFDVFPEITLGDLSQIKISRPVVEVTEADVDRLVDNLRKARRTLAVAERAAQAGDVVTVDFEGKLDGEAFQGGKSDNASIEIGEARFLPDLENGLIGHSVGETFDVAVNFPADYRNEALAGKATVFSIVMKEVREPKLPELDEEFLKVHGIDEGGAEALRSKCREALEAERTKAVTARVKREVMDQLHAMHPIDVPSGLVGEEVDRMRTETINRIGANRGNDMSKMKPEQLKAMLPGEMFEPGAKGRVALGLLVGEVITSRQISIDPARVDLALDNIAGDFEDPEEVRKLYRSREDLMQRLRSVVLEEQVVETLAAGAQVTDEPMSLEDLLKSQQQAQPA
ncbi:trigger factor [Nevskia sp.]|uniref:trigger factor n=1 Tax=Nevskia sp. TaxID=1929292 RepID=UPI0025F05E47|nr:trigger factor [Nevskia sp.]